MPKYLVDVFQNNTDTYRVEANTPEEASANYADGTLVHSENSGRLISSITEETGQ